MNKLIKTILILAVVLGAGFFVVGKFKSKTQDDSVIKEVLVTRGSIQTIISTTGTILPKNRLEVRPPVGGRIESILVKEGQQVKTGQTLAWMSSTERAALLDAARGQGDDKLKYWQEAYKPIALLAPIDAEVIVATTQPGQTVTATDAVIVLSDTLIGRAQVDETDIRKVKLGQKAQIVLDAFPDTKINAVVEHMYYESQTVNNVTIYLVDLVPENIPDFFRSGMNTTINFIESSKDNVLIVPLEAVYRSNEESFLLVKKEGQADLVQQSVKLGIADDKFVEIAFGVNEKDVVVIKNKKFVLPKSDTGSNPFTPFAQRKSAAKK